MKTFRRGVKIIKCHKLRIVIFCSVIFLLALLRPMLFFQDNLSLFQSGGAQLSNFDFICSFQGDGIVDFNNYIFVIIPLYSVMITFVLDEVGGMISTIRFGSRSRLWNTKVLYVATSAFILSTLLIIGTYLVSGLFLGTYSNAWNTGLGLPYKIFGTTSKWLGLSTLLTTPKVLLVFWITTFLGFLFIGLFICMMKVIMSNLYIYLSIIIILFMDFFNILGVTVIRQISVTGNQWLNIGSIFFNSLYFIFGIVVFYLLGKYINLEKDQYLGRTGIKV